MMQSIAHHRSLARVTEILSSADHPVMASLLISLHSISEATVKDMYRVELRSLNPLSKLICI